MRMIVASGYEVIDVVIRPKTSKYTRHDDETTEEPKQVLRRVPLKQVLQLQENIDTVDYYKPNLTQSQSNNIVLRGMRTNAMKT